MMMYKYTARGGVLCVFLLIDSRLFILLRETQHVGGELHREQKAVHGRYVSVIGSSTLVALGFFLGGIIN